MRTFWGFATKKKQFKVLTVPFSLAVILSNEAAPSTSWFGSVHDFLIDWAAAIASFAAFAFKSAAGFLPGKPGIIYVRFKVENCAFDAK